MSYEIKGPSVSLTCTAKPGIERYIWKLDSDTMYVDLYHTSISEWLAVNRCPFRRNEANTSEYIIPNNGTSAAGSYTCQAGVSYVLSSDSPAYVLTATGFLDTIIF